MERSNLIAALANPLAGAITIAEAAWEVGLYQVQQLSPEQRTYVYACLHACGYGLYGGLADIAPILLRPRAYFVRDERQGANEPTALITAGDDRWLIVSDDGPMLEWYAESAEDRLTMVWEMLHHLNPNSQEDRYLASWAAAILNIR